MSPEYFHRHLTFGEADDYLAGLNRRYRAGWEQARLEADVAARCAGNKDGLQLEFPWDKHTAAPGVTEDERRQMEAEARALERRKNGTDK